MGGSWSATPICYDCSYSGDTSCDTYQSGINPYLTVPLVVSGYTQSTVSDLRVYGNKSTLVDGYYKIGVQITGTTGVVGTYWGANPDGYTAYTINDVNYFDYPDGTTIFVLPSSGMTSDMFSVSAITKNEALMNVIDQPQIQTNVYVERGKNSAYERVQRLGEVDNLGDIINYGYNFFNVEKADI
jgi:hypothetical protein